MNCSRHPEKRTINACKDCGAGFCIDCVRETDQTTYCFDCYRRRLGEITREVTSPPEKGEGVPAAPSGRIRPLPTAKPEPGLLRRMKAGREKARREAPSTRERFRGEEAGVPEQRAAEAVSEEPVEDFLAKGPDEDFSALTTGRKVAGKRAPRRRVKPAAPKPPKVAEPPPQEGRTVAPAVDRKSEAASTPISAVSEDILLKDVVSTLLGSDSRMEEAVRKEEGATAGVAAAEANAAAEEAVRPAKLRPAGEPGVRAIGEERLERWSFLAQPRSAEYTTLSTSWWRSAAFIALVLLGGALLWALPNAYLIPRDREYGIHSFIIGLAIGLVFWWKAGKKHGTKLAVQAALTTFFALFIGEFLHWFLIIVKNQALRTIFFDLISFKFLWEEGPTIFKNVIEAMFPLAFLWLLLLPTAAAFVIGFGMPPIPEIFFQIGRALKGQSPGSEEARHGLES